MLFVKINIPKEQRTQNEKRTLNIIHSSQMKKDNDIYHVFTADTCVKTRC